jgi:hypothetical protein
MGEAAQVGTGVPTAPDRHLQGVEGEVGAEAGGNLPADDHAGRRRL